MSIIYDDDSTIAQFKIYEYLGRVFDNAIQSNGEGERIFSHAGISSLIPKYQSRMTPFTYNGPYENQNVRYNPIPVSLKSSLSWMKSTGTCSSKQLLSTRT